MKVVVFGATGVVGRAAVEHFAEVADGGVIAVSRRPVTVEGVTHVAVDLADESTAARAIRAPVFSGTTHVVYAALQESPELVAGWRDTELMAHNLRMFRHALDPLAACASTLEHVSLLQGAKAYGLHVGRNALPAKERSIRDDHDNFYFLQEDALRALAEGASWSWTILRPQVVFGESIGSPMNLLPAIGVYAAVERARGRPLAFPGGAPNVHEAVDARLLARALGWAAVAPEARGETFNVTNGDVFDWHDVWPAIADSLGMDVGEPHPQRLTEVMPPRARVGRRGRPLSVAVPARHGRLRRSFVAVRGRALRRARATAASRAAQHGEDPPSRLRRLHRHRGHVPRVVRHLPATPALAAALTV